jgi:sugar phosphate isomerase/epimerase
MMPRFGISTHLFHNQRLQREHLLEIAASGFRTIEVFATRTHFDYQDPGAVDALASWIRDAGLELHSIHAPVVGEVLGNDQWGRPFFNATRDEAVRREAVRETEAALSLARRIPAKFLVMHVGTPSALNPGPEDNSRAAVMRSIEEIESLASPLGVRLALEIIPNPLSTPAALVTLIEDQLELPGIGICLDFGHTRLLGDPVDAIETASGHVTTTHVHDNSGRADEHLVPFEGSIDWASVLMAVEKIGYDGVFMFELRNTSTPAAVLARAREAQARIERMVEVS